MKFNVMIEVEVTSPEGQSELEFDAVKCSVDALTMPLPSFLPSGFSIDKTKIKSITEA